LDDDLDLVNPPDNCTIRKHEDTHVVMLKHSN